MQQLLRITESKNAKYYNFEGGEIKFENVTFTYEGAQKQIFENFNLTIPKHSFVSICGESGAGKSTLIKLIVILLRNFILIVN